MDCLACFDLKAIFDVFLSIFVEHTDKYKNIKFHDFFLEKSPLLKPLSEILKFPHFDFYFDH